MVIPLERPLETPLERADFSVGMRDTGTLWSKRSVESDLSGGRWMLARRRRAPCGSGMPGSATIVTSRFTLFTQPPPQDSICLSASMHTLLQPRSAIKGISQRFFFLSSPITATYVATCVSRILPVCFSLSTEHLLMQQAGCDETHS